MSRKYYIILIATLLYSFTNLYSQCLSGTFTIGGSNPNYINIQNAVSDLNTKGVCGPVVFNIRPAEYRGKIYLKKIEGASATNTVTFQSETQNNQDVVLTDSTLTSDSGYVVCLKKADYVILNQLTIQPWSKTLSIAVQLDSSSNCKILNSRFIGLSKDFPGYNPYINAYACNFSSFENNSFESNSMGVNIYKGSSNLIKNNTFINQHSYAVQTQTDDQSQIVNNKIFSNSTSLYYYGIYSYYSTNILIASNKIESYTGGMFLRYCTNTNGGTGIIRNNMIAIGSTIATYGLIIYNSVSQQIVNNSIHLYDPNQEGNPLYLWQNSYLSITNNALITEGTGIAYKWTTRDSTKIVDYNACYSRGLLYPLPLAQIPTENIHSLAVKPIFVSNTDLHIASGRVLYQKGLSNPFVTDDVDGNMRGTSPTIGADEYSYTQNYMSGTYTIDPAGNGNRNYISLNEAITDLNNRGIDANVVFNIASGVYKERLNVAAFDRLHQADSVIFQSADGKNTSVTITDTTLDVMNKDYSYVVRFYKCKNVTFKDLTVKSTSSTAVFELNDVSNDHFINNRVIGFSSVSSPVSCFLISSTFDDITFENNEIRDANAGIQEKGYGIIAHRCLIKNNRFIHIDGYNINFTKHTTVFIYNNYFQVFKNSTHASSCISIMYCTNGVYIEKNKIEIHNSADSSFPIAIDVEATTNLQNQSGSIINNAVSIDGARDAMGISLNGVTRMKIYHNSISVHSNYDPAASGRWSPAASFTSSDSLDIRNNIFNNLSKGISLGLSYCKNIRSDYNDLYSNGPSLAYVDQSYKKLDLLIALTALDSHSVSVPAFFTSLNDLHVSNAYLYRTGTPLATVNKDIDGMIRSNPPCIGAYEFTAPTPLSGIYSINPSSGDYPSVNDAVDALINRGVNGNVIFNIADGEYPGQVRIPPILGAGPSSTVIFQALSADSSKVIINQKDTSVYESYALKLDGADYITFKKITFKLSDKDNGTENYVIDLVNGANHNQFTSNQFISRYGNNYSFSTPFHCAFHLGEPLSEYNIIEQNYFDGGLNGISYYGNDTLSLIKGVVIQKNTFIHSQLSDMYLAYLDAPSILSNNIYTHATSSPQSNGINIFHCRGTLQITGNNIRNKKGGGIEIEDCIVRNGQEGVISNNMVQSSVDTLTSSITLSISNSGPFKVYHNTLYNGCNNFSQGQARVFLIANSGAALYNNVFISYKAYITSNWQLANSDNNCYYTQYKMLTPYDTTLNDWKIRTGKDSNSVFIDPKVVSVSDLHLTAATPVSLHAGKDLLTAVPVDIDGSKRSSRPWMGAHEYDSTAVNTLVWPGDANNDLVADHTDLLTIGQYYGQAGTARNTISNEWKGQQSVDWNSAQTNGSNLKHADCNGDGTIDQNDTLAITLNYGKHHTRKSSSINYLQDQPFLYFKIPAGIYKPGDWLQAELYIGKNNLPASDLYGMACTVAFDKLLVESGSMTFSYVENIIFGKRNQNSLMISNPQVSEGKVDLAITRIDHQNSNGTAKVGTLKFQISKTISNLSLLSLDINSYVAVDANGNHKLFNVASDTVKVIPVVTNMDEITGTNHLSVYPNPYRGITTISYTLDQPVPVKIQVLDLIGREILTLTDDQQASGKHSYPFSLKESGHPAGIYFLRITVNGKNEIKKIIELD